MHRAALLLCSLSLVAGAVQAQAPGQPHGQPPGQAPGQPQGQPQGQSLEALHDALHLDRAQEDAWRTFQASAATDTAGQVRAQQTAAMLPRLATPRRLALIRAQMQADLADFDRSAAAVTEFYNTLSPDQQRTFDQRTAGAQQRR